MSVRQYIKRLFKSKFIHNTGWIMFAQIYQMILSLVIGTLGARYLGPSNYGTINYAASYISFFSIACALGLEGIVVKEMIDDRTNEGVILGSSIVMRLGAGALSMFAVCVLVAVLNPGDRVLLVVTFLQSLALLFNAAHIIETWYQSVLWSKIPSVIKCIAYTGMSLYRVLLLATKKSVEWFAFAASLDALIIAVLFFIRYKRDGRFKLHFNLAVGRHLVEESYHLIISYLMAAVYNQMDRLMIGRMIDQTHVGYYSAASTICHMWLFIPTALANSASPLIMELRASSEELYIKRIKQLTGAIFWLGVIFAIGITLSADLIIDIMYGPAYTEAKVPLIIIVWSTVFSALSNSRSIWMICEKKQKYAKHILFWGVLVNLALNSMWIPTIGMNGAATATILTEGLCCFVVPYFIKQTRNYVRYQFDALNPIRLVKEILGK